MPSSYTFIFLALNYNQILLAVYINIIFNIDISAPNEYPMGADSVSVWFSAMIPRCMYPSVWDTKDIGNTQWLFIE